jgi:hypothetical protein
MWTLTIEQVADITEYRLRAIFFGDDDAQIQTGADINCYLRGSPNTPTEPERTFARPRAGGAK